MKQRQAGSKPTISVIISVARRGGYSPPIGMSTKMQIGKTLGF